MKKNNHNLIIIIFILVILSCIAFYVGQFLFSNKNTGNKNTQSVLPTKSETLEPPPVEYKTISTTINGFKQQIFLLSFDPTDTRVEFKPALSYDNIFGFESLSEICKRTDAYAAVNAGFFYENGDPVGMVAIDGKLLMNATGSKDPVLFIDKSGAEFKRIFTQLSFTVNGNKTYINKLNRTGLDGNIILYTSEYGSTNRATIKNTSVRVKNGTVYSIIRDTLKDTPLQKDGLLISFFGRNAMLPDKLGIKVGDKINVEMEPQIDGNYSAYECGCMLVENGVSVVPEEYKWVGTLKNRDPRTAIGIKENGQVVLVVVDGRQPDYSTGFTGKELADYLISIGVKSAAMLDGGATSQMYVDGNLKNKSSYRGMERPVAGAFIVKVTK